MVLWSRVLWSIILYYIVSESIMQIKIRTNVCFKLEMCVLKQNGELDTSFLKKTEKVNKKLIQSYMFWFDSDSVTQIWQKYMQHFSVMG